MSDFKPFVVCFHKSAPNPWKVAFILEELGLTYQLQHIELEDMKKEPYILLNPNGRTPTLIDPNRDITLWESGAIINYLIDTYDDKALLHYTTEPEKHVTRSWEHFQMSGQGPYFGQLAWFRLHHWEKVPSAIERYDGEVRRVIEVIDTHLGRQGTKFLVGDRITYADIMWIPYFKQNKILLGKDFDGSKWVNYSAWLHRVCERSSLAKTMERYDAVLQAPLERAK